MKFASAINPFRSPDSPPPQHLFSFFAWCLQGSLPFVALGCGVSMLAGIVEVGTALLLGWVIDAALASDPERLFSDNAFPLIGLAAFFLILKPVVFGASSAISSIMLAPNIGALALSRLHRHTIGQSVTFFDEDFAGRLAQKQLQTSRAVTDTVIETVNGVAFAVASLIGSLVLLSTIDWYISLVLAFWLLLYVLLIRGFMPRIRARSAARAGARSNLSGQIVDTVTNIKTVKIFAHSDFEDRAALDALGGFRKEALGFGRVASAFRFTLMALSGVLPVVLVGGALLVWKAGDASAGDIAATGAVSLRIAQMSGWISFVLMAIYSNVGEAEDGMRTLAFAHRMPDSANAETLPRIRGRIEFENVSFSYGNREGGVTEVSFAAEPGEKIGLVGSSGAGKSTLAALIMRLYDPDQGQVLIDGNDTRLVTQESLRRQISMVTQETAMFNRSAFDNIRYGRPDASRKDVLDASKRACAHEFIMNLCDGRGRQGYDAYLGERGVRLSGGQRQRIALARAILKDAPILILDEATSALDSTVEAEIQDALRQATEGRTVIAIAHRLSTILGMERILVLDQGRIAEQGTHKDLLAQGGLFAEQWDKQVSGFIGFTPPSAPASV